MNSNLKKLQQMIKDQTLSMKRHRKEPLQNVKKTIVTMTGTLSLPLRIGENAWIRTRHQFFTTSMVLKIMEVAENGIKFETCNTIYHLRYETVSAESGVMCA